MSIFRNQKCSCGKVMNLVMFPPKEFLSLGNGFAKETATFIISDDLTVMPNVFGTVIPLLQKLEITNIGAIVEESVEISKQEAYSITLILYIINLFSWLIFSLNISIYFHFCR